jgi:hypothetical protein
MSVLTIRLAGEASSGGGGTGLECSTRGKVSSLAKHLCSMLALPNSSNKRRRTAANYITNMFVLLIKSGYGAWRKDPVGSAQPPISPLFGAFAPPPLFLANLALGPGGPPKEPEL